MARRNCFVLTGLVTLSVVVPAFRPGLCCTIPSGLKRTFCDSNYLVQLSTTHGPGACRFDGAGLKLDSGHYDASTRNDLGSQPLCVDVSKTVFRKGLEIPENFPDLSSPAPSSDATATSPTIIELDGTLLMPARIVSLA
jgi:hypothetical protein